MYTKTFNTVLVLLLASLVMQSCSEKRATRRYVSTYGTESAIVSKSNFDQAISEKANDNEASFLVKKKYILVEFFTLSDEAYQTELAALEGKDTSLRLLMNQVRARVTYFNQRLSLDEQQNFSAAIYASKVTSVGEVFLNYQPGGKYNWKETPVISAPIEVEGMYYTDARMKYFEAKNPVRGTELSYAYQVIYSNVNFLTSLYFSEPFRCEESTITFVIPPWLKMNIWEKNLGIIQKTESTGVNEVPKYIQEFQRKTGQQNKSSYYGHAYGKSTQKDETRYLSYKAANVEKVNREVRTKPNGFLEPHLYFAITEVREEDGSWKPIMKSVENLFGWYSKVVAGTANNLDSVRAKSDEVCRGLNGKRDKVEALYYWVQDHIRYVAFEDGLAGFQPESCQKVFGNGFGDCKGMANLLVSMLKTQGIDADLCWLGTRHVAYDYSEPSLASDNHMIARVEIDGATYYLDPTEDYIALGDYAHRIQGRPVLFAHQESYSIDTIPNLSYQRNLNDTRLDLAIKGNVLEGKFEKTYRGESRTSLLRFLKFGSSDRRQNALERILKSDIPVANLSYIYLDTNLKRDLPVKLSADIQFVHQLIPYDSGFYILLHIPEGKHLTAVDSLRRVGINFPYKIFDKDEIRLEIPALYKLGKLPDEIQISSPSFQYKASYKQQGKQLIYQQEFIVYSGEVPPEDLKMWRKMIFESKKLKAQSIQLIKK